MFIHMFCRPYSNVVEIEIDSQPFAKYSSMGLWSMLRKANMKISLVSKFIFEIVEIVQKALYGNL